MFKGDPSLEDEIEAKYENTEGMINDEEDNTIEQYENESDEESEVQDVTEDENENGDAVDNSSSDPLRRCRGRFRRCKYIGFVPMTFSYRFFISARL